MAGVSVLISFASTGLSAIQGGLDAVQSKAKELRGAGLEISAAFSLPILAFGKQALDAAVSMESLTVGLKNFATAADPVNAQLARLRVLAQLPGLSFKEAIQGSIQLQAVGFSAREAERDIKAFGNAIALGGSQRPREDLNEVLRQLQQVAGAGKLMQGDLRVIEQRAPAVRAAIKAAFGTTDDKAINALGLDPKELINRITAQLEKLPQAGNTLANQLETAQDTIFQSFAKIGAALTPVVAIVVDKLVPAFEKFSNWFTGLPKDTQTAIVTVLGVVAVLGPLLVIVGQVGTGIGAIGKVVSLVLPGIASLGPGLIASLGPALPYLLAIGATIAAIMKAVQYFEDKAAINTAEGELKEDTGIQARNNRETRENYRRRGIRTIDRNGIPVPVNDSSLRPATAVQQSSGAYTVNIQGAGAFDKDKFEQWLHNSLRGLQGVPLAVGG